MSDRADDFPRATLPIVLATVAIDALGFGIVIPVVPSLVRQIGQLSAAQASLTMGMLLAAFSVMQFLCAPLLGALSDRFGRRPVLIVALAGMCANYVMLAWAPAIVWLFIGRIISGATAASYSTATACIADVTPPEKRAQRFGLVGAMFGLGFVAGPALGGLLGGYGLRYPFILSAVLAGLNCMFAAVLLPETLALRLRRPVRWREANPVGSMRVLTVDRSYRLLALAWCCTWFALGVLQSSFVLANELRLGWSIEQNGLALAGVGVGAALVQGFLVRRIVPWLGERRAALVGYGFSGCAYLAFAFALHPAVLFFGIALQAFGAISGPAVQSMFSQRAGPARQGGIQGALASVQGLTAIAAPLAGGWVFSWFAEPASGHYFPGAPFVMAALAYLLALWAVGSVARA